MRASRSANVKAWVAVTLIVTACAIPFAVGIAAVLDPIARNKPQDWVAVTTLQALPIASGPKKIPVSVPQFDAWTRRPNDVVGYVFLNRVGDREMKAFRATYHLSSTLEFDADASQFWAPCWKNVRFDIEGHRLHSIREWGDIRRVRSYVDGDVVYVSLSDVTNDNG